MCLVPHVYSHGMTAFAMSTAMPCSGAIAYIPDSALECMPWARVLSIKHVAAPSVHNVAVMIYQKFGTLRRCWHADLVQLQSLRLGWCSSVSDDDMRGLQNLSKLTDLQLSRTKVGTAHGNLDRKATTAFCWPLHQTEST